MAKSLRSILLFSTCLLAIPSAAHATLTDAWEGATPLYVMEQYASADGHDSHVINSDEIEKTLERATGSRRKQSESTREVEELFRRAPGKNINRPLEIPMDAAEQAKTRSPALSQFDNRDFVPLPDRWRIIDALEGKIPFRSRWWDPYNQNVLKGDRPVYKKDWFVALNVISDSIVEPRSFPQPVGFQSSLDPDRNSLFGKPDQTVLATNLVTGLLIYKGATAYKPPDYEIRITPVFNLNYVDASEERVLHVDPQDGTWRLDEAVGWQELFIDKHLRNVSDRYDFDSVRVGIQPFSSDFRGFLFQDNQPGIRFFGNRDNNHFQYNLAWFKRLEKDSNSGLNDLGDRPRADDVFIANLYRQDWPVLGLQLQGTIAYNRNREGDRGDFYDDNDFLARPAAFGDQRGHNYDVTYLGGSMEGHYNDLNISASSYFAIGKNDHSVFSQEEADIRAFFIAAEPSYDMSWIRLRGSLLYATGDKDPYDNEENGYDAIFENPQFAGADTSYWVRQAIPLIGGGGVQSTTRNGILPSLRSSKEHGQSNFINPGLRLAGVGADLDLTPETRLALNINRLWFTETEVLEQVRLQGDIHSDIGTDISAALTWRPNMIQNIVFRLSGATLLPGRGFEDLYSSQGDDRAFYSVLGNIILTY